MKVRSSIRSVTDQRGIDAAGTGSTYVARKNRRTDPDRMVLRTHDPRVRRHVDSREER